MVIDKETYNLTEKNYYNIETNKKLIVLGNSLSDKDNHITGWENRMGGEYKKTSTYTIFRNGEIYEHFNPSYYSSFVENENVDKKIISITLENQGWLNKDLKNDRYFNWVGNIYKRNKSVYEKRWRGFVYWDSYTNKQMKSCVFLIKHLCDKFNIENKCVGHNTYIDGIDMFEGITYRSNFQREYTDLNPSWDFKKFKELIEN
jgi:hypothetical protein